MNLLPSEVSLQMRFDAFCKKVITYTNYKLLREGQKRREQGYVFSDFEEGELEQYYYTYDTYPALALKIELEHIRVFIENEMLYQALLLLPNRASKASASPSISQFSVSSLPPMHSSLFPFDIFPVYACFFRARQ